MKLTKLLLYSFLAFLFLQSCTHKAYRHQPRYHDFKKSYAAADTLYIKNYVMNSYFYYSNIDYRNWYSADSIQQNLNTDSIFSIFKKTLLSLNLPIKFEDENTNQNDSTFIKNSFLDFNKIDFKAFENLKSDKSFALVPVFSFINNEVRHSTFTGNVRVNKHIILSVFIFMQDELFYYKSNRIVASTPCPKDECSLEDVIIGQDLWGDLVYQAMRQYIKRLK